MGSSGEEAGWSSLPRGGPAPAALAARPVQVNPPRPDGRVSDGRVEDGPPARRAAASRCSRTSRYGTNWLSSSAPHRVHACEPPTAYSGVLLSRLWSGWTDAVSGRPTRHRDPMAADRLQALLEVEEPPERARPPGRRPGGPRAHPTDVHGQPLWGAPRIHGELQKLGVEISQAAVSKYVVRHRKPPSPSWRTFLDNHLGSLVSVDFFVVPTVMFKVLFVFLVLAHDRRRVVHVNVTDAPTAQWTAQQIVEALPWETAPRYLLRDRDAVYGVVFSSRVQALGIREVKAAPRSPWQNPYVERLIGTLRRECLDHVVVLNETHRCRWLRDDLVSYHRVRTPPLIGEGLPGA